MPPLLATNNEGYSSRPYSRPGRPDFARLSAESAGRYADAIAWEPELLPSSRLGLAALREARGRACLPCATRFPFATSLREGLRASGVTGLVSLRAAPLPTRRRYLFTSALRLKYNIGKPRNKQNKAVVRIGGVAAGRGSQFTRSSSWPT